MSLDRKMAKFKSLRIFKIIHIKLVTRIYTSSVDDVIPEELYVTKKNPKIEKSNLSANYEKDDLKNAFEIQNRK